ncbi:pentatricopeptide repeat-containing protein At5g06540-like [Phalaenopsis equestris]|uniref:pentatricopeptide repeat-containing protein At5g06540-like n=1 Tax=Phalaenopsis equestris TaxID=78828 RepID=UPI0009E4E2DC|nr:pentatricopeptide repeat-containing protein At5g06540-like [Phalaenopsis equestris]
MLAIDSFSPDKYTYTFLLTSCTHEPSLSAGDASFAMAMKSGFAFDLYVANSLLNMHSEFGRMYSAQQVFDEMPLKDIVSWTNLIKGYAKQGNMDIARKLFDELPHPNEVSWVIMIAGYVKAGNHHDAVKLFNSMLQISNDLPHEPTIVSVLSACTHIGALTQGRWIHAYIEKISLPMSINITNALIDMYSKCGIIESARELFIRAPERDLLTWSCMISGLALHGRGNEALELFSQMIADGVKPDNIAVLHVLNGCSHSGLVDEGCSIFHRMSQSWGITPEIEHYGCLIDLLGRAGELQKALGIIIKMPLEPDIIIWRSILGACRNYRNVELGERILDQIVPLECRKQGGGHLLVSNLYATAGRWEEMAELRSRIRDECELQKPGWSCIEVDGEVHEFVADDRLHLQIVEIRQKLTEVLREVAEKGGYLTNTEVALFDLSKEDREQAVHLHSEKLAVSFGLMSVAAGCSIRIVKSLRICEDCHSAMKAISFVFEREIVVRDRSRFHTFKEGKCSCYDYW